MPDKQSAVTEGKDEDGNKHRSILIAQQVIL